MAWHPDRFEGEKQKSKAEDELKKINSARDLLNQHFQKEHVPNGPCSCRPAVGTVESPPSERPGQASTTRQQTGKDRPFPLSYLSKQTLVTLALAAISLVTVGVYFKVATGVSRRERTDQPAATVEQRLAPQDSSLPINTQLEREDDLPVENLAPRADSALTERPPILPMSSDRKRNHAPAGTFYAGFLQRKEQRQKEAQEERRSKLRKELDEIQRYLAAAMPQLADLERRVAPINKEIGEHVEVMGELERVNSDLEAPATSNQTPGTSSLYYSNPDYKSHGDRLMAISVQQKELQGSIVRLKQQIELAKSKRKELESELSAI